MRLQTMKDLAQESLDVQNASNLSGVVWGFANALSRLKELLPKASTEDINRHPICILWADKIASLTHCQDLGSDNVHDAYERVRELAEGKS